MDKPADFGRGPPAEVRRWLKELDLAEKTEKDFRDAGDRIWKRYRGIGRRRNSYNILWSNTETLGPALFNTPPSPDVRRRFRDEDPVGKIVSQVLERCLEFQTDTEPFMHAIKCDVLDAILPGRGLSRIKYVPTLVPAGEPDPAAPAAQGEPAKTPGQETPEGDEVLAWEQCEVEHVQWDDFRHGPGKTWPEVQWEAFRHRMTREELTALCGEEIAKAIALDKCDDEAINKSDELKSIFGTAVVWEFWCKEERKVRYIAPGYLKGPIKEVADPLKLIDFYPNPRPLYAICDSASLNPVALFDQYKEQADELDRISMRINKIVDACKARGVYDATMAELSELMRAEDNKLVPIQNAALWAERGGLDKAIFMMPIVDLANVLQVLYEQREATKAVIYELSGIADVRRGSTDPNETLGAQKLKADFGNQRISGLKLEVERYVRDLMRLMSELIAGKFQPETLTRMAQMQIPTEQQIEQKKQEMLQQMAQQAQQQPAQPGQPPQPVDMQALMQQLPPRPTSLEQVMEVLHDDATRMFKIDVETDSMVSATVQEDMQGLQQVLTGVVQFIEGVGPAVQAGAFPVEAVKEIVMTICRRSKMGSAVEDALDKIKAPKEQGNPEQAKAQAAMQAAQAKAAADKQIAADKARSQEQIEAVKAQAKVAIDEAHAAAQQQTDANRQRMEAAQHAMKLENEARLATLEQNQKDWMHQREMQFEQWKVEKQAETQITVAQISAEATLSKEQNAAADAAASD